MDKATRVSKTTALWNVRMRASKKVGGHAKKGMGLKTENQRLQSNLRNSKSFEAHISGAEGLYEFKDLERAVKGCLLRATNHSRGMPDSIAITLERIRHKPAVIPLLPVSTIECRSSKSAAGLVKKLLSGAGVSKKAIRNGLRIAKSGKTMRGACIMLADSGARMEPDKERGIRVSRLGIETGTQRRLSKVLSKGGINTPAVKEALILASKAASCKDVIAELCISDDPDYTTGYVATQTNGYVRIPNIKDKESLKGGRVFFIRENADLNDIINYLENTPVLAGKPPVLKDMTSSDETISDTHC